MPHFGLCKHMEHSARKLLALESQCHPFSDPASEEHNHSKHNTEKMALVAMTMHKKNNSIDTLVLRWRQAHLALVYYVKFFLAQLKLKSMFPNTSGFARFHGPNFLTLANKPIGFSLATSSPTGLLPVPHSGWSLVSRAFWPLGHSPGHPDLSDLTSWSRNLWPLDPSLSGELRHSTFEIWHLPILQPRGKGHWALGGQCFAWLITPAVPLS